MHSTSRRSPSNGCLHSGESGNPVAPPVHEADYLCSPNLALKALRISGKSLAFSPPLKVGWRGGVGGWVLVSAKALAATEETHSPAGGESEQAKTSTAFSPPTSSNLGHCQEKLPALEEGYLHSVHHSRKYSPRAAQRCV